MGGKNHTSVSDAVAMQVVQSKDDIPGYSFRDQALQSTIFATRTSKQRRYAGSKQSKNEAAVCAVGSNKCEII